MLTVLVAGSKAVLPPISAARLDPRPNSWAPVTASVEPAASWPSVRLVIRVPPRPPSVRTEALRSS